MEKIEENAYNFLWESAVQYMRNTKEAMGALKSGEDVPIVPPGSYWEATSRTNFSILEQLNYFNGNGLNAHGESVKTRF